MPRRRTYSSKYLGISALVMCSAGLAAELDAFERFYGFSRSHEVWSLDEIATLLVFSALGLAAALIMRSQELHRALMERDLAEREARAVSFLDPLSGLPNRRGLQSRLDRIRSEAPATGAVDGIITLMIDLDRFKQVNDLHGHEFGDAVLKNVACRLSEGIGVEDFVARLGGDEFAIVLRPESGPARAERLASRLIAAVERPIDHNGISVMIGCSIGLSHCQRRDLRDAALRLADQALYAAKRAGRGRFAWYNAALGARATERALLEADLRQAVREEAIVPFFQPIVDMISGTVTGFEVLARWMHPERGLIPPTEFIGIAEEAGLIRQLGTSILRQACLSALEWDPRLKLSYNVSPQQFRDSMLVASIQSVLRETGYPAPQLEVEVTEAAITGDFEMALATIQALQKLGISVALDDFGTGISSLSKLRQLPFDRIKVDRNFIADVANSPDNQKILMGIMNLAQGLDLSVTAEGIETETEMRFLVSIQCASGQGFWFDRPLTAKQAAWMLDTRWSAPSSDFMARDRTGPEPGTDSTTSVRG